MGWDCSKEKVVKAEDRKIKETFSGWAKIGSEFFEQVPTGFWDCYPERSQIPGFYPIPQRTNFASTGNLIFCSRIFL